MLPRPGAGWLSCPGGGWPAPGKSRPREGPILWAPGRRVAAAQVLPRLLFTETVARSASRRPQASPPSPACSLLEARSKCHLKQRWYFEGRLKFESVLFILNNMRCFLIIKVDSGVPAQWLSRWSVRLRPRAGSRALGSAPHRAPCLAGACPSSACRLCARSLGALPKSLHF